MSLMALAYQIAETSRHLSDITGTSQSDNIKAGRVAEELHVESFNLAAIVKGSHLKAHTERHEGFSNSGYKANAESDIVVMDGRNCLDRWQSKYHATAEKTTKASRALCQDGSPKYLGIRLLVPADQMEAVRAEARRTRLKNEMPVGRPAVAKAAEMVEHQASDRVSISNEFVESLPLSLHDARAIAKNPNGPERGARLEPILIPFLKELKAKGEVDNRVFNPNELFESTKGGESDDLNNSKDLIISVAEKMN